MAPDKGMVWFIFSILRSFEQSPKEEHKEGESKFDYINTTTNIKLWKQGLHLSSTLEQIRLLEVQMSWTWEHESSSVDIPMSYFLFPLRQLGESVLQNTKTVM